MVKILASIAIYLSMSFGQAGNAEQRIRAVESTLVKLSAERAVVFDQAGNVIAVFDGDAYSVGIPLSGIEGMIVTHNHVDNSTFSTRDIDSARNWGLYQARVVLSGGSVCTMTTTPGHPFADFDLDASYDFAAHESINGALVYNWNAVWRRYAAIYGLRYGCSRLYSAR